MKIDHLPYVIDESKSKNHYYETYWKVVALKLLSQYISNPNGMTLLDYGCGRGETMRLASDAGYIVSGADIDETCLDLSKQWGATIKLQENSEDITHLFDGKTYDVITCFHVLEHIPNPLSLLKQLRGLSNQYILLAVPNLRQLHGLRRNPNSLSDINSGHLQGWDHGHLLNMATVHAGLKLVAWTADATVLPLLSGLVYRIFGMKAAIKVETGLFKKLLPYHSISIIGLFEKA